MIMTWDTARDAIFGAILEEWESYQTSIFGGVRELRFQDIEKTSTVDQDEAWGYCEMYVTRTAQAGLRNDLSRRYTTSGTVVVDVYVPRHAGSAPAKAGEMADKLRRRLEGSREGGVWFRNVTASPAGQAAGFAVSRVTGDFEYTEEGDSDGE